MLALVLLLLLEFCVVFCALSRLISRAALSVTFCAVICVPTELISPSVALPFASVAPLPVAISVAPPPAVSVLPSVVVEVLCDSLWLVPPPMLTVALISAGASPAGRGLRITVRR